MSGEQECVQQRYMRDRLRENWPPLSDTFIHVHAYMSHLHVFNAITHAHAHIRGCVCAGESGRPDARPQSAGTAN